MPLPAKLVEATQAHLEQLIAEQAQEGPHLDFKRELPANWDNGAKHELFADVSAFANSGGGDLVYGIAENDDGAASSIAPMAVNADNEVQRLLNFLMTGVEPRIPGLEVQAIPVAVGDAQGFAIVVRVPQSWVGPHRVRTNFKFYLREGNRKRDLDVPEIRGLFLRSDTQAQRIRDFRTERLGKILSGDIPCKLVDGAIWVLHLVPTQAVAGQSSIDPTPYLTFNRHIPCIGGTPANPRVNLDGALGVRNPDVNGATHGYTQLFRNGFVEAVKVMPPNPNAPEQRSVLPGSGYEPHAAQFLNAVRAELLHAGITPEVVAMMTLLHAERIELGFDRMDWAVDDTQGRFDRPTIVLPDVLIPSDAPSLTGLRPMFDLVWQAAGMPRSINFNAEGEWVAS